MNISDIRMDISNIRMDISSNSMDISSNSMDISNNIMDTLNNSMDISSNLTTRFVNKAAASYIGIILSLGLIGNGLVLYVYGMRFKPSQFNTFIVFLAITDFLFCVIYMPLEISNMAYSVEFDGCASVALIASITSMTTGQGLIAIAVLRFNAVCRPLKPSISIKASRYLCVLFFVIAVCLSWPTAFLYENIHKPIGELFYVTNCAIGTDFDDTIYPALYNGLQFLIFLAAFVSIMILYCITGSHLWKRKKYGISTKSRELSSSANDDNQYDIPHKKELQESASKESIYTICEQGNSNIKSKERTESLDSVFDRVQETQISSMRKGSSESRGSDFDVVQENQLNPIHTSFDKSGVKAFDGVEDNQISTIRTSSINLNASDFGGVQENQINSIRKISTNSHGSDFSGVQENKRSGKPKSPKHLAVDRKDTLSVKSHIGAKASNKLTPVKMLIIMTLLFFLSYVPHLCLTIYVSFGSLELTPVSESFLGIIIRSYLLSSVCNPIVYGCYNRKFRDEVKVVLGVIKRKLKR